MYGLMAFSRASLFVSMQSLTSFKTASLLVREAMSVLLNIFDTIYSNVGTCGLGANGVLALEEWVGDVGVMLCAMLVAGGVLMFCGR